MSGPGAEGKGMAVEQAKAKGLEEEMVKQRSWLYQS